MTPDETFESWLEGYRQKLKAMDWEQMLEECLLKHGCAPEQLGDLELVVEELTARLRATWEAGKIRHAEAHSQD